MPNYANIVKNANPFGDSGGYKNVFLFAPRADFLAIVAPAGDGTTIGDTLQIDTAHTFTAPKGFISWDAKQHSVTLKGTTVGDEGSLEIEYSAEFSIIGDGATKAEQLQRILNDDVIALLKEADCVAGDYIQLGDECVSPTFKVEFDGHTTKEGKKEYKVTCTCKKRYYYSATVTLAGA